MLGDHLGSTSLTTSATGTVISEIRYKAWGEVRYASGTTPTKYQFTGQYSYQSEFGLLFYNARWVDPSLGRFAQADSIVAGGVQGLDRYVYTNNNPLRFIDPSGHGVDCGIGMGCVKDYTGASTLDDFRNMGWNERKYWLDDFVHERDLGNWFNDISGAIAFMSKDPVLKDSRGSTYYMDAAVLFEINNGWNIYRYGYNAAVGGSMAIAGANSWAKFFRAKDICDQTRCDPTSIIDERLQGEDDGVNFYAWPMTLQSESYSSDNPLSRHTLEAFLSVANLYRDAGIWCSGVPNCAGKIDPRTAGPILATTAQTVQSFSGFDLWYWMFLAPKYPTPIIP